MTLPGGIDPAILDQLSGEFLATVDRLVEVWPILPDAVVEGRAGPATIGPPRFTLVWLSKGRRVTTIHELAESGS